MQQCGLFGLELEYELAPKNFCNGDRGCRKSQSTIVEKKLRPKKVFKRLVKYVRR